MILAPNEYYVDSTTLKRKIVDPATIKPHIILVVLESFLGSYCGFINQKNTMDLTSIIRDCKIVRMFLE